MTMDQIELFVRNGWSEPVVRGFSVVLAGLALAKLTQFVFARLLKRLTDKTETELDDRLIRVLERPIFLTVLLIAMIVALPIFSLPDRIGSITLSLFHTALVLLWLFSGARVFSALLEGLSRLVGRVTWIDARTVPLLDNLAKLVIFGGAAYCLLKVWDLDATPLLASASVMGIAVGFAAKDSIANLFGGLSVIMDSPYQIGDYINLDSGERGKVVAIGLRSTRLLTRDDVEITVPNGVIANAKVINESGGPWKKRRVAVTVGVAYGSDVAQVRALLLASAKRVNLIDVDPEPRIRFIEMGDSALIFRVLGWITNPELRGQAIDALNTEIYNDLNSARIVIPFPQRDVHLYRTDEKV